MWQRPPVQSRRELLNTEDCLGGTRKPQRDLIYSSTRMRAVVSKDNSVDRQERRLEIRGEEDQVLS